MNKMRMRIQVLLLPVLMFSVVQLKSQKDLSAYLATHHYPFSLEKGFEEPAATVLQEKLAKYRIVLQGEGGSHFLQFYRDLEFMWLYFLNRNFGTHIFFGESGH